MITVICRTSKPFSSPFPVTVTYLRRAVAWHLQVQLNGIHSSFNYKAQVYLWLTRKCLVYNSNICNPPHLITVQKSIPTTIITAYSLGTPKITKWKKKKNRIQIKVKKPSHSRNRRPPQASHILAWHPARLASARAPVDPVAPLLGPMRALITRQSVELGNKSLPRQRKDTAVRIRASSRLPASPRATYTRVVGASQEGNRLNREEKGLDYILLLRGPVHLRRGRRT